MRKLMLVVLCLVAVHVASVTMADVKLPALICDNMVLQRDIPVAVWGTADPGEKVSVSLCGNKAETVADAGGAWKLKLPAMPAGGPFEMTVQGKNTIPVRNLLVGEVWVCSGQSNMQMSVAGVYGAQNEIAEANWPKIRLFGVKLITSPQPLTDVTGSWQPCSPSSVPGFSAVGYFFGRELHKALDVPVGLINTSWGGTPAESWTSLGALESNPDFQPMFDRWTKYIADYPKATEKYNLDVAAWKQEVEKAKAAGTTAPRQPGAPLGPDSPHRPANLYNAMIAPLVNYAIRGAIWYQGESNAGRAYQYRDLLKTMISDWRRAWGQGDFPFGVVQLANYMACKPQPAESAWAELREAQTLSMSLPNVGMATIIDIGDAVDIHPRNKQDVGKRLALWALAQTYGKDIAYSGPMYDRMAVEGSKIRLWLKHTNGGLTTPLNAAINGFSVAGEDKAFYWADAVIDGDTVVVSAKNVEAPVAVRYAWADNPACNLFNGAGLPAAPFRTDDWPGVTAGAK